MADKPVLRKTGKKPYKSKSKEVKFYGDPAKKSPKKPYVVLRDVQNLQQRKRVSQLLQTESFISELEGILKNQVENNAVPKLRRPEENTSAVPVPPPPPPMAHGSYSALSGRPLTHPLGITPINDLRGSLSSKYSVAEKQERCKLAALYRLVDLFGWSDGIYGHISCRVPGHPDQMLLNPFGLLPSEITASNLVKVDLDGNIIDPGTTQYGINSAGLAIHSAILGARPDINCVCHVHGKSVVAVSAMGCGLLPISQESTLVGGISYHNYHGIAAQDEMEMIVRDFGDTNKVLMLRNHGLVATGATIEETLAFLGPTVQACDIQVAAMSAGLSGLIQLPQELTEQNTKVVQKGGGGVSKHGHLFGVGELEFEAYMRQLDSKGYNTGYKYKGKHLMQQKSNVTVHRTPEEQKEWEQFMKERKARAEERRAKRLAESATCHKAEEKAQEEEDDDWAFVDSSKTHKPSVQKDGARMQHVHVQRPVGSRRRLHVDGKAGESAFDRAKRTAEKVAKSTGQAVVAQNVRAPEDTTNDVVPTSEQNSPEMTSFQRTKQTAQSVALSTTQAVGKLTNDTSSPPPVKGDCNKENHPANHVTPEDDLLSGNVRVESKASLGTKVRTWLDDADQNAVEEITAVGRMKATAEQVAQSTTSAVEKLSESLQQEFRVHTNE